MFLLALACTDAPDPVDTASEVVDDPSAYIYDEVETVEPALSAEDVVATLTELTALLPEISGRPVLDAYNASMSGQQSDCPDYYESDGNLYWYDYCYADDGTYFTGYGFGYVYDDYVAGNYAYTGEQVYTVAEITSPEGYVFAGGGSAGDLTLVSQTGLEHTAYQSVVEGAFSYDGPEGEDTWMSAGLTPDMTLVAYDVPETTAYYGRAFSASGSLGGLGGGVTAVVFTDFSVTQGVLRECNDEPSGTVSIRDEEGLWYDVVFDAPVVFDDTAEPMLGECDGCGEVYFRGESLGQACVDFSALVAWEVTPW